MPSNTSTVLVIHQDEDPGGILVLLADEEEVGDSCREIKTDAERSMNQNLESVGPFRCISLLSLYISRASLILHLVLEVMDLLQEGHGHVLNDCVLPGFFFLALSTDKHDKNWEIN
jgi:hypothetical protein